MRCTPLTFLLAGFGWLLLAALGGVASLVGLVQGTPLPTWLRPVHTHGALVGGLLQLALGGLLASAAKSSDSKKSASHTALFISFNIATAALIFCLGYRQGTLTGLAGLLLFGLVLSQARMAFARLQESLAGPTTPGWVLTLSFGALLAGLTIGVAMPFGLIPEYHAHARLAHIHLLLFGFSTMIGVAVIHRLLPEVFAVALSSSMIGRIVTMAMVAGSLALLGGFLTSSLKFELGIGALLILATAFFITNLFRTWLRSPEPGSAAGDHLLIAGLFLLFTIVTGTFMGANYLTDSPMFPIGSLHLAAYTHMALIGFLVNVVLGAISYGLPTLLAEHRIPQTKKRQAYVAQLTGLLNRWRALPLVGMSLGTMGLAVIASMTWSHPLGSLAVRTATWVSAGLLVIGFAAFAAKLTWALGQKPSDPSA